MLFAGRCRGIYRYGLAWRTPLQRIPGNAEVGKTVQAKSLQVIDLTHSGSWGKRVGVISAA